MVKVIHLIKGKRYAYDHYRVGSRIHTKYLYPCDAKGRQVIPQHGGGHESQGKVLPKPEKKPRAPKVRAAHKPAEPAKPARVVPQVKDYTEKYGEVLNFSKFFGQGETALYVGAKVSQDSLNVVEKIFNALPSYARKGIDNLELFGESQGYKFKVGDMEFTTGGHWSASDKTIRAFNTWSKHIESSAVRIYVHEAGHNLWHKLEALLSNEQNDLFDVWIRTERETVLAAKEDANKRYLEYVDAWETEKEKLINHRIDLEVDSIGLEDKHLQNKMLLEVDAINDKIKAEEDKIKSWYGKIHFSAENGGRYDPHSYFMKWLETRERPVKKLLDKWWDVTEKEGGLTGYSQSYVKSNSSEAANENFAEAFSHWGALEVGLDDNPYEKPKSNLETDWTKEYNAKWEAHVETKATYNRIIKELTPLLDIEVKV